MNRHFLELIGITVKQSFCPAADQSLQVVTMDEATGKPVDLEELLAAERAAFHNWHSSMAKELRAKAQANPTELVEAYLWFRVEEPAQSPSKDAMLGDPLLASASLVLKEAAIRKVAADLSSRLATLPEVDVVTKVAEPIIYDPPIIRLRANLADLEIMGSWPEVWRLDVAPDKGKLLADDYYWLFVDSRAA